jgi:hypothetical protein
MEELVKYMKALVFLQVQQATGQTTFGKPELLLSQAGFSHKEIGEILGKKANAVGMAIARAKKSADKDGVDNA